MVSRPANGKKTLLTWILVLTGVLLSGLYATTPEIREDALDLLPESIVSSDLETIRQLGMINRVYLSIGIDTGSPEISDAQWQRLRQSVQRVGTAMQESSLFSDVVFQLPPGLENTLFKNIRPLLPFTLTDDDYRVLSEAVTKEKIKVRTTPISTPKITLALFIKPYPLLCFCFLGIIESYQALTLFF